MNVVKKRGRKPKNKIIIKGPGGGILPKYISLVENRTARKSIKKDHPIRWEDI